MKDKKFKLTSETKAVFGIKLFRIKALKDFGIIKKGELGGWIEKESNLSQEGNAWVSGDAGVSGNAWLSGDAWVFGNAWLSGNAWVFGNTWVSGKCKVTIKLCSRFNFETQEQIELWQKKEEEFEKELNKLKEKK